MSTWLGSMLKKKTPRKPYTSGGGSLSPESGKITIVTDDGAIIPMNPQGTDTIPAMLSPKEMVINKDTVNAAGGPKGIQDALNGKLQGKGMQLTGEPKVVEDTHSPTYRLGTTGNIRMAKPGYYAAGTVDPSNTLFDVLRDIASGHVAQNAAINTIGPQPIFQPEKSGTTTAGDSSMNLVGKTNINQTGGTIAGINAPAITGSSTPSINLANAQPAVQPAAQPTAQPAANTGIQSIPGYSAMEQLAGGNSLLDRTIANRNQANLAGQQTAANDTMKQNLMQAGATGPRAFGSLAMQGNIQGAQQATLAGQLAQNEQTSAQNANKDIYAANIAFDQTKLTNAQNALTNAVQYGSDADVASAYQTLFGKPIDASSTVNSIRDAYKQSVYDNTMAQLSTKVAAYSNDPANKDQAFNDIEAALEKQAPASATDKAAWAKQYFDNVMWPNAAKTSTAQAAITTFQSDYAGVYSDSQMSLLTNWIRDSYYSTGATKDAAGNIIPDPTVKDPRTDPKTSYLFTTFDGNKIGVNGNVIGADGKDTGVKADAYNVTYTPTSGDNKGKATTETEAALVTKYQQYVADGGLDDQKTWLNAGAPTSDKGGTGKSTTSDLLDNFTTNGLVDTNKSDTNYSSDPAKFTTTQISTMSSALQNQGYSSYADGEKAFGILTMTKDGTVDSFTGTSLLEGVTQGATIKYLASDGTIQTLTDGKDVGSFYNSWLMLGAPSSFSEYNILLDAHGQSGLKNETIAALSNGSNNPFLGSGGNDNREDVYNSLTGTDKSHEKSTLKTLAGIGAMGSQATGLKIRAKDQYTQAFLGIASGPANAAFDGGFSNYWTGNAGKIIYFDGKWIIPSAQSDTFKDYTGATYTSKIYYTDMSTGQQMSYLPSDLASNSDGSEKFTFDPSISY